MSNQKKQQRAFNVFKSECEKWIDKLGLKNYDFKILLSQTHYSDSFAECWSDVDNGRIQLVLSNNLNDDEYSDLNRIKMAAFHEVCHTLVAELIAACSDPKSSDRCKERAEEHLIRRMENCFFKA